MNINLRKKREILLEKLMVRFIPIQSIENAEQQYTPNETRKKMARRLNRNLWFP